MTRPGRNPSSALAYYRAMSVCTRAVMALAASVLVAVAVAGSASLAWLARRGPTDGAAVPARSSSGSPGYDAYLRGGKVRVSSENREDNEALQSVAHRSVSAAFFLGILVTGFFLVRSVDTLREVDAARDQRAESFGRQVLSSAPQNAILFARGDRAVFALWYFHFALAGRPDLAVVAENLLHFDWCQDSLRASYPSLKVPGPFPGRRPLPVPTLKEACTVQFDGGVEMHCTGNMTTP